MQNTKRFLTYFMKGPDKKQLEQNLQSKILKAIQKDPLSSSFLIYNPNELVSKVAQWKRNFPWITPHYAIKSNPIDPIISNLSDENCGFDCASKDEIKTILKKGVDPSRIVFSNSIKNEKDIAYAVNKNVILTTCDTLDEIKKINEIAPGQMKILWRIAIKEDNPEKLATLFSGKFGDDFINLKDAQEKFSQIKKMGVKLEGIHFHCGSGQHGSSSFNKAVELARSLMDMGRKQGHNMETLDVGGGFPGGDLNTSTIEALKVTQNDPLGYKVIAEPGRYFSSSCCNLAVRVIGKRLKNNKPCYHLNDSVYHSFNCILMDGVSFENQNDVLYSNWESDENTKKKLALPNQKENSTIFGMTCDGMDIICKNIELPELNIGDWIVIGGMGSYTYGVKSLFNGMRTTEKIISFKRDKEDEIESIYKKFKI